MKKLLFVTVLLAGCQSGAAPVPHPPEKLSAKLLNEFYGWQEARANATYTNKHLTVTGTVAMQRRHRGAPVVVLDTGSYLDWVECVFDGEDEKGVRRLAQGQEVEIHGLCRGRRDRKITLERCVLLKAQVGELVDPQG